MKVRGYLALGSGIFILILVAAIWIFVAWLATTHESTMPAREEANFLGRLYVGFAMLLVCGAFGTANGMWTLRRGRPNPVLTVSTLVVFVASLGVFWEAGATFSP